MRKYIFLSIALGLLGVTSCDSDIDSNPTLLTPTTFVLNTPAYASTVYDLEHSTTLELTCSQPDYGFTAPTDYLVQVSLTGQFVEAEGETPATYSTLSTVHNTAKMNVNAQDLAVAIVNLSGITDEDDYYTEPIKVYFRLKATVTGGYKPILSNVIELPEVLTYFALDPVTMPANMYMIGSFCDWDWTKSTAMVPVHSTPGKFWRVFHFDNDAELKFNFSKAWDGTDFGYTNTQFPNLDFAGLEDKGGNILITKGGWYIVVVTTAIEGRDYKYTVEFVAPNIYLMGNAIGGWSTEPSGLFTVPAAADGEFVSPAFVANVAGEDDGGVRICVKLEGQEWWHTEFMIYDSEIEYRGNGNDQEPRISATAGQKAYLKFVDGTGSIK